MQRRQTRDQWKGSIRDWQGSGQSQRQYCTQRDLSYSAFRSWRRKFKTGTVSEGAKAHVRAVEVARIEMRPLHSAHQMTMMELDTRGIVIPIFGSTATVTIVGRVSLGRLGRIITACEGNGDHAQG
jgi:hypothetical protein